MLSPDCSGEKGALFSPDSTMSGENQKLLNTNRRTMHTNGAREFWEQVVNKEMATVKSSKPGRRFGVQMRVVLTVGSSTSDWER